MATKPTGKASLFDDADDEDEVPTLKAKKTAGKGRPEENPLSFFSFGSPVAPPTSTVPKPAPKPAIDHEDDDDADDDFFTSPPSSLKQKKTSATTSSFNLDEEDDIELPKPVKGSIIDHGLSFKDALHPGGLRPSSAAPTQTSQTEKQQIASLQEQLTKATHTIKKLKEKEKSDAAALESALHGIESNISQHVERANKADAEKNKMEADLRAAQEQVRQLQAQNRQQAAVIEQMNLGGVPIPTASAAELDWFSIHQKHKLALRMLSHASQEATAGLELLMKNAPVLNDVALLLRDINRISDDRSRS